MICMNTILKLPRLPFLLLLLMSAGGVCAQTFPARPIRFIVPFAPGGAGDLVARAIAAKLTETWGKQVVIDNRAGGGGNIGVQLATRAAPDGYTLLLGTQSTQVIGPILQSRLPYDPVKDLAPVALTMLIPNVLVSHPSVAPRNVKDLIAFARAKPGQLSYSSSGTATSSHLAGALLMHMTGIELVHVPYKGGGPALADVLAGHVQLMFGSVSTSLPHVRAGKLNALGIASAQRTAAAPEYATIAESGLPGFEVVNWLGVLVPAGTPRPLVAQFNEKIGAIVRAPDFVEHFIRLGMEPAGSTPAAFGEYMRADREKWSAVITRAGIRAE